jgi:hypothetical protein
VSIEKRRCNRCNVSYDSMTHKICGLSALAYLENNLLNQSDHSYG